MTDKEELREQFVEAFEDAAYPVTNPMDLLPALPDGPATTFESGEFEISAVELNNKFSSDATFPYRNAESLADDLVDSLEDEGNF